jgi:hypothetical protein
MKDNLLILCLSLILLVGLISLFFIKEAPAHGLHLKNNVLHLEQNSLHNTEEGPTVKAKDGSCWVVEKTMHGLNGYELHLREVKCHDAIRTEQTDR